ncbi:MAG: hypothetical protein ACE145_20410 [Terriglobia bacterium]
MKRFVAGVVVGIALSTLALFAQKMASEKVVPPQPILENERVKIQRWLLKPGEGTPLHTHTLPHVSVILRGSTTRDVGTDGVSKDTEQKTGAASYIPGTGRTHSFANVGKEMYESISIELK